MFAHNVKGQWRHVYSNEAASSQCGDGKVYAVTVTEDDEGSYWAWWEAGISRFCMVYPTRAQVEVCFPYGIEKEEEANHGRVCQVRIDIRN